MTKEERLKKQRESRKLNGNFHTKKYEKTHKGFVMRLYRNMKSRVEGVQQLKHHLYEGKELLSKEAFYEWALNNEQFFKLFEEYSSSGFLQKLAPSVDRIDSRKGYTIDNMEFVTHSENSRRGNLSKRKAQIDQTLCSS